MENKFNILCNSLAEWNENSQTDIIEAKTDKKLLKYIKERGLSPDDRDLMFFKTRYLKFDEPNLNGVIVGKNEVEKGLDTIIGKPVNLQHLKSVCRGFVLAGDIEGEYMHVYGALFKRAFPEEAKIIRELFATKKLYVSFEIHALNRDGSEVLAEDKNGNYVVTRCEFVGCAIIDKTGQLGFGKESPACKEAEFLDLVGNEQNSTLKQLCTIAEEYSNKVLEKDIIYAELIQKGDDRVERTILDDFVDAIKSNCEIEIDDEIECSFEDSDVEQNFIEELEGNELIDLEGKVIEAKKMQYKERKNLDDSDFAVVVKVKNKKTGGMRKIRMFPIHDEAHVRNALVRLAQEKVKKTLKELGVSIQTVEKKILQRAKKLGMTDLLKRHVKSAKKEVNSMTDVEKKVEELKARAKELGLAETATEEEIVKAEETKKEADVKAQKEKEEAEAKAKKEKEDALKARAKAVGLEETVTEEEIVKAEEAKKSNVEAKSKTITEENVITVREEDYKQDGTANVSTSVKGERKVTTKYDNGREETRTEKIDNVSDYVYAMIEEKINEKIAEEIKAEKEKMTKDFDEVVKAKQKEVDDLKAKVADLEKTGKEALEAKDKEVKDLQAKLEEVEKPDLLVGKKKDNDDENITATKKLGRMVREGLYDKE